MPLLKIQSVVKRFKSNEVLSGLSIDVQEGEFLTLLGASGSGKTTLLRLIAGFETLDAGSILIKGDSSNYQALHLLPPQKRPVNTVFQNYTLFMHLSVFDNVAYGLKIKRENNINQRVMAALEMVKMSAHLSTPTSKLSGGQQQRIALARAIINRPRLLLLDEPLSALDAGLRSQMQNELKNLQKLLKITFLFVTHDQHEAMALSDRIVLLKSGSIEQLGTPEEIYHHPNSEYAAQFIGKTNILRDVQISGNHATWNSIHWKLNATTLKQIQSSTSNSGLIFSLRPEHIKVIEPGGPNLQSTNLVRFQAQIVSQIFEGPHIFVEANLNSGGNIKIQIPGKFPLASKVLDAEFDLNDVHCISQANL